eukprot:SAG11_NODE_5374_length_1580_cov_0.997974_2_plen_181_part_00
MVGTGLPELVAGVLGETGVMEQLAPVLESGITGGVAAPGPYFGASVSPREIGSAPAIFRKIYGKPLDVVVLGGLEFDEYGNVNVSRNSEKGSDISAKGAYVGPGGFMDLAAVAHVVLFVVQWMNKATVQVDAAQVWITASISLPLPLPGRNFIAARPCICRWPITTGETAAAQGRALQVR